MGDERRGERRGVVGRKDERRGWQQTDHYLGAPQASEPDEVCGGDRFEALEAQLARVVDQCARCRAVAAIRMAASTSLLLFFFLKKGGVCLSLVSVSMLCILSSLRPEPPAERSFGCTDAGWKYLSSLTTASSNPTATSEQQAEFAAAVARLAQGGGGSGGGGVPCGTIIQWHGNATTLPTGGHLALHQSLCVFLCVSVCTRCVCG